MVQSSFLMALLLVTMVVVEYRFHVPAGTLIYDALCD